MCKRSYQAVLGCLYTEAIKRQSEISLHKHFNIVRLMGIAKTLFYV